MSRSSLSLTERVLALACAIQQVPSPTFAEGDRAAWLQARLQSEGLDEILRDSTGNVLACLRGAGSARPLVVSAHLDTVFPAGTDLTLVESRQQITGPGIGDNSLGLASLLGLVWMLKQRDIQLPGDLWLAATVGEEGLGDLRGMRAVVDRFCTAQPADSQPFGYIILEGMGLGEIFHRGLGVRRFRIRCDTPGGHSWIDYGHPSAVHELARMVTQLVDLPLPRRPRTSLNIGTISGGTSVNTIASQASLELDLRSEEVETLEHTAGRVESLVHSGNRKNVRFSSAVIGNRPAGEIALNHPLVRLAADCLRDAGIESSPGIGSTDANIPLSRGIPAVCIGMTRGGGAHTLQEHIQTHPLGQGLEQLYMLATRAYSSLGRQNTSPQSREDR